MLALKLNPEPVVCEAVTATLVGVQVSVPGPMSLTTVAVPVVLLAVTPLEDETLQLTNVEPLVEITFSDSEAAVLVGAVLITTCAQGLVAF